MVGTRSHGASAVVEMGKELGIKVYGTNFKNGVRSQARRRKGTRCVSRSPRQGGAECLTQVHCDLVFELWCQRNTRTESAPLRHLVTGHAPFFFSACHLGLRRSVRCPGRSPSKANRPLKAPLWPHLQRGFSFPTASASGVGGSASLWHLLQLRPRLPGVPALLKLRLRLL